MEQELKVRARSSGCWRKSLYIPHSAIAVIILTFICTAVTIKFMPCVDHDILTALPLCFNVGLAFWNLLTCFGSWLVTGVRQRFEAWDDLQNQQLPLHREPPRENGFIMRRNILWRSGLLAITNFLAP